MHHGTLPLGLAVVILQEAWPLTLCFVSILLWIFPDGTLPPDRWHRRAVVLFVAGLVIALATSSSSVLAFAGHGVRIQASGDLGGHIPDALVVLSAVVIAGTLISWLTWAVLQVPMYRRASGERRQQLKWLYSGAAILVASTVIGVFIVPLSMGEAPGYGTQPVVNALGTVGTAALPVGMGVAVLKYRLYELNRVISRVVSYALITALLAGVFFGRARVHVDRAGHRRRRDGRLGGGTHRGVPAREPMSDHERATIRQAGAHEAVVVSVKTDPPP